MEVAEYKGMQFIPLYTTRKVNRFVVEYDRDKKLVFEDVTLSIVVSQNSYKYGSEFQVQFWTKKKPTEKWRTPDHNGYYRGVGYLPEDEGKKLVRALTE